MFHTCILASRRNGTLYTGSTDSLCQRIAQHQNVELVGTAMIERFNPSWRDLYEDIR